CVLAAAVFAIDRPRRKMFVGTAIAVPLTFLVPALAVSDFLILDNRLYLPLAVAAAGAGIAAESWLDKLPRALPLFGAAWGALCLLLAASTVRHAESFESSRAFCESAVRGSPHLG